VTGFAIGLAAAELLGADNAFLAAGWRAGAATFAAGFLGSGLAFRAFDALTLAATAFGFAGANLLPVFFADEPKLLPDSRPFLEDFEDDFPLLEAMDNSPTLDTEAEDLKIETRV
jgi:hypothetical protein